MYPWCLLTCTCFLLWHGVGKSMCSKGALFSSGICYMCPLGHPMAFVTVCPALGQHFFAICHITVLWAELGGCTLWVPPAPGLGRRVTSQAPWDALSDAPAHSQVKQGKTSAVTPTADEKSFVMFPKGLLSESHLLLPRIPLLSFSPFLYLQIRVAVLSCVFRVCSTCRLSRSWRCF